MLQRKSLCRCHSLQYLLLSFVYMEGVQGADSSVPNGRRQDESCRLYELRNSGCSAYRGG